MPETEKEEKSNLIYIQKIQIKNEEEDHQHIKVRTDRMNIAVVETVEPVFSE